MLNGGCSSLTLFILDTDMRYAGALANSADPDEMPLHQGLHCLLR